ncbi:MAG TPA: hypothetical protein G4O04_00865 [Anaerolineae bacterium]|nr:hypothetical protein [Anaerolineae bacterium]HIQ09821.1 hypothetical protein [Anaerolineaceae bacterium]
MTAFDAEQVKQAVLDESVLVDRQGIVTLYEAVHKMMGIGLGGLLYRAGKIAGRQSAALLQERLQLAHEDLIEGLVVAFNTARWGHAQLERTEPTWRLTVQGSVLASQMRSKKPVCHPIAGYWAGFLEFATQRAVDVQEVQCAATGAPACVFEVRFK